MKNCIGISLSSCIRLVRFWLWIPINIAQKRVPFSVTVLVKLILRLSENHFIGITVHRLKLLELILCWNRKYVFLLFSPKLKLFVGSRLRRKIIILLGYYWSINGPVPLFALLYSQLTNIATDPLLNLELEGLTFALICKGIDSDLLEVHIQRGNSRMLDLSSRTLRLVIGWNSLEVGHLRLRRIIACSNVDDWVVPNLGCTTLV